MQVRGGHRSEKASQSRIMEREARAEIRVNTGVCRVQRSRQEEEQAAGQESRAGVYLPKLRGFDLAEA